ncbi:V-type ATPase subunit [Streptococcus catagoni]|uniref:V-type ATPase subunit n=1 Tax=Streptococcus catagoni TaxID=2654874 RepID=UPI00140BFFBC|nr:V-type ATPase subunit [Streptococcus catagoni]
MDKDQFSQINTTVSVKEKDLLSAEQFKTLINASSKESIHRVLQETPYHIDLADLDNLNEVERVLMKELARTFKWAFEECPVPEVIQLFSLPYFYHNLKVLLKSRASQKDLNSLLIPIGMQPLSALEHLVRTLKSDHFPEFLVEEVQSIWKEYLDYGDSRVLEIGADLAYFKHLKKIAKQLDDEVFLKAVSMLTDSYNLITIKRAQKMKKSHGFIKQLLTDQASLSNQEFIDMASSRSLLTWYHGLLPDNYSKELGLYESKIAEGKITIPELEYLSELLIFQLFDANKYSCQGPYVIARFLLAKEFEIKNLRLILSAQANQLPLDLVKERMRPLYGQ